MGPSAQRPSQPHVHVEQLEQRLLFSSTFTEGLRAHWRFDEDAGSAVVMDTALDQLDGDLYGDAAASQGSGVIDGALSLSGAGGVNGIPNANYLNTTTVPQRTISLWFKASDPENATGKQVLFEEGGTTRGFSIYLDGTTLYAGAWNTPGGSESGWAGTFLSTTGIDTDWHHVVLTLDGSDSVEPDVLKGYLDGVAFGSGSGSQVWSHTDAFGIGGVQGTARFHDGTASGTGHGFNGLIDELKLFNVAADLSDVQRLYAEPDAFTAHFKFDETSGTAAVDYTGNQASGDVEGSAVWLPTTGGIINGGLQLDGSNDAVRIPDAMSSDRPPFTFSLWFNPDEIPTDKKMVLMAGDLGGIFSQAASISIGSSTTHGSAIVTGRPPWFGLFTEHVGSTPVTANTWNQLAISYDGYYTRVFLNGNLEIEERMELGDAFADGLIGRLSDNSSDFVRFKGVIDDARVYERGLSEQQVQDLWAEGIGPTPAASVNLSIAGLAEADEQNPGAGAAVGVLGERFGDGRDALSQAEQDAIYGGFYAAQDTRLLDVTLGLTGGTGTWKLEFPSTLAVWQQVESGDYARVVSGQTEFAQSLTETIKLKVEGVSRSASVGDSVLKAVLTAGDGTVHEDQIDLTVFDADLSVDSDNNDGLGAPDGGWAEQWAEEDADGLGKVVLINDSGSVLITGNAWKQTGFGYTVTADTVLAFDYKSDATGEQHLIGALNNGALGAGYQLHGSDSVTGTGWHTTHRDYATGEGWRRQEIAIGQDYTGSITDLLLVADDDANAAGQSLYRDIVMYEAADPAGTVTRLDLAQAAFIAATGTYAGEDDPNSTATYSAAAGFTPSTLKVDLPADADPATALIEINYSAWATNGTLAPGTSGTSGGGGHYRLWLKPAEHSRDFASLKDGGDYLAPGSYTAAELGLTSGQTELTVWAQAIDHTDPLLVDLSLAGDAATGGAGVIDATGNDHHATTVGNPTAAFGPEGLVDTALHFDGNDALTINTLPDSIESVSVGLWAQSDTAGWSDYGVLASRPGSFVLHPNKDTNDLAFKIWIDGTKHEVNYNPDASFDITEWHHYLGTYDAASGELNLYVDGQVVANKNTGGGAMDPSDGAVALGRHNTMTRYLEGSLSEVRLYTQALGTLEAHDLATIQPSEGLLGQFNLGADQGDDAAGGWRANFYAGASTVGPDGLPDSATQFNGTDQYVQILGTNNNANAVPPMHTGLTVGVWAKSDTETWNANGVLIERRPTFVMGPVDDSSLFLNVNVNGVGWRSVGVDLAAALPGFKLTDWHHYAGSHDATTGELKLYVDGQEVASATVTAGNLKSDPWAIFVGRDTVQSTRYFDGALAQATLYGQPLTDTGIATLATLPDDGSNNNQTLSVTVAPYGSTGPTTTDQIRIAATIPTLKPIQNLTASVLSPSEVEIQWESDPTAIYGYAISVSSDGGQSYTGWMSVPQGANSALVEGLAEDTSYSFSVSSISVDDGAAYADGQSAAQLTAATPPRVAGQPAKQFYRVALPDSNLQKGSADYYGSGSSQIKGLTSIEIGGQVYELVEAESPRAAIMKAVTGSAHIVNPSGGFKTYRFGGNEAFKVDTFGNLNAGNFDIGTTLANEQYLIALEDTFQWTNIDQDYDDWYWAVDVEVAPPFLTIDDVSVAEPAMGDNPEAAVFTVSLSGPTTSEITVDWAAVQPEPVSAEAGNDFVLASGTLTFTPGGDLTQEVSVDVLADDLIEPDEFFEVVLSTYGAALILDDTGLGTIYEEIGEPIIDIDVDSNNDNAISEIDDLIEAEPDGKLLEVDGPRAEAKLAFQTDELYDAEYDWVIQLSVADGGERVSIWSAEVGGAELAVAGDGVVQEWPLESMPSSVWVQGEDIGGVKLVLTVIASKGGSSYSSSGLQDEVRLHVLEASVIDLDVDSLNDSGFTPPEDNLVEDRIEEDRSQGKFIDASLYDTDGDDIPDFADGFDVADGQNGGPGAVGGPDAISEGKKFAPIVLRVQDEIDWETATVTFSYAASDPAAVTITETDEEVPLLDENGNPLLDENGDPQTEQVTVTTYNLPENRYLRIWTKDGFEARDKDADYIHNGEVVFFSDLPVHNGPLERILWVEAVNLEGQQQAEQIRVVLTDTTTGTEKTYEDIVTLQIVDPLNGLVDLDVDSDNLANLNESASEDLREEIDAKITELSIRDLNENSIPDFADLEAVPGLTFAIMVLKLDPPDGLIDDGYGSTGTSLEDLLRDAQITFDYDDSDPSSVTGGGHSHEFDPYTPESGTLRVWKKDGIAARSPDDFVRSGVTYTGADLIASDTSYDSNSTFTLWVEAVNATGGDIPIKVTVVYGGSPGEDPPPADEYGNPVGGVDSGDSEQGYYGGGTSTYPGGDYPDYPDDPEPEKQTVTAVDIVLIKPSGVDLDIDSDNNAEDALGDLHEDVLEDVGTGKILVAATSDRDGNGTLDYADGIDGASGVSGEHLVPLDIALPEWVNQSLSSISGNPWVVFNYAASNPAEMTGSHSAGDDMVALSTGNLRLWTQNESRLSGSATGSGNFLKDAGKDTESIEFGESIDKVKFENHRVFIDKLTIHEGKFRVFVEAIAAPENGLPLPIEVLFGTTLDLGHPTLERDVVVGADQVLVTVIEPAAPMVDGIGLNGVGDGADGGNPLLDSFFGPLRLDGQLASLVTPELAGDPFAWSFGQNRAWSNDPVAGLGALAGPGHVIADLPFLVHGTSTIVAVFSPTNQLYFDRIVDNDTTPDAYRARFFAKDMLTVNTDNTIELVDSAGNTFTFHGYAADGEPNAVPDVQMGKLKQIETAAGHEIDFEYKADGLLDYTIREIGTGVEEKLAFEYQTPVEIVDRADFFSDEDRPIRYQPSLQKVKLLRVVQGEETITRSVSYEYYGDGLPDYGRIGDLKQSIVSIHHGGDEQGVVVDRSYYRYEYQTGGSEHPSLSPQDLPLTALVTMDGSAIARSDMTNFDQISTQDLIQSHAATEIRTQYHADGPGLTAAGLSAGDSVNDLGLGGYELDIQRDHDTAGLNAARYTATLTQTHGDAPVQTFELNAAREVTKHTIEGGWVYDFNYDSDGRLVSATSPAQLTERYDYFDDTDPAKQGLLKQISLASDDTDTPDHSAILTSFDYFDYDGVMRLAEVTEHIDDQTASTTSFVYAGPKGTAERSTILPAVSAQQHGTDSLTAIVEKFDIHGNITEVLDANGTHTAVYNPTALTLTETSGGLTSVTTFDELGNIKSIEHADHTFTYFHTYQDADKTIITSQSGWKPSAPSEQVLGSINQDVVRRSAGTIGQLSWAYSDSQAETDFDDASQLFNNFGTEISNSLSALDKAGRVSFTEASGIGVTVGAFTEYVYDTNGQLHQTHRFFGAGTGDYLTDTTVFDTLGRIEEIHVAGNKVQSFVYDDGGVGDGNITLAATHPGVTAPDRVTLNVYDWRNRLVAQKQGVETTETDINRPGTIYHYDNLDRIIETAIYDADGITPSYDPLTDAVTWSSGADGGTLVRTDHVDYDARGQVYQTRAVDPNWTYDHDNDPATDEVNATVITGLWYDDLGRVIKQKAPGGLTTKTVYNNRGQVTDVYLTDDASGDTTAAGDTQLEHTHTDYDNAGNAIFTKTTQHRSDGSDRTSAVSRLYDDLGRIKTIIDHGAHGASLSGQTDIPRNADGTSGSNSLRIDYEYSRVTTSSNYVDVVDVFDAENVKRRSTYNAAGQLYGTSEGSGETDRLLEWDEAATYDNQTDGGIRTTTFFEYDGLGRVLEEKTIPIGYVTSDNVTLSSYVYENDGTGSYELHLPGYDTSYSDDENRSYIQKSQFNFTGELVKYTPEAGPTHSFEYDAVGRLITDTVTSRGPETIVVGEDRRREYTYNPLGQMVSAETKNGSSSLSLVSSSFNAFGQITDYTSTNYNTDQHVQYHYENAKGGVRSTGLTYPDGTQVIYGYTDTLDDRISRITDVSIDRPEETGVKLLESYQYLGLGTPHTITNPLSGGGSIVQVRDFDAFGRLAEQDWSAPGMTGGDEDLHFTYHFDANGNLGFINDQTTVDMNSSFTYDALNRLTGFWYKNGSVVTQSEAWRTDELGLNRSVEDETQRLADQDAILPTFQGWFDQNSSTSRQLLEDTLEEWQKSLLGDDKPAFTTTIQFDPWGRVEQRKIWSLSYGGDNYVPTFEWSAYYVHDAVGHLIRRNQKAGTVDTHIRLVNDAAGRILLEESHNAASGTDALSGQKRYVWSPVTGNLILRDHDSDANGWYESRHFTPVDLQGNTVALLSESTGEIKARLWYTPSGEVNVVAGVNGIDTLAEFSSTYQFSYLFSQGRHDGFGLIDSSGEIHGGVTIFADGTQYSALDNGVVSIHARAYWDDVDGVTPDGVSWWSDTVSPVVHVVLDVVGLVPGVGIFADGINAGIYLAEGDREMAALSGIAAIPGIGYGAVALKYGHRGLKLAKAGRLGAAGGRAGQGIYRSTRLADYGANLGIAAYGYSTAPSGLGQGLSAVGGGFNGLMLLNALGPRGRALAVLAFAVAYTPDAQGALSKSVSTLVERINQTPKSGLRGAWTGVRGRSTFVPARTAENSAVNRLLDAVGLRGVSYRLGKPNFSPFAQGRVTISRANYTSKRRILHRQADTLLARQRGWTRQQVEIYRKANNLSWHELSDVRTLQLVPTKINDYFGHFGGISEARRLGL